MTEAQATQLSVNTIRTLSIDAVQQANSGHPGTPMALAPLVYTIWNRVMQFDPADPIWPGRDRFVLLGQPSMTLNDIRLRQLDSKGPGHRDTPRRDREEDLLIVGTSQRAAAEVRVRAPGRRSAALFIKLLRFVTGR